MGIVTSIAENLRGFLNVESGFDAQAPAAEVYVATTEQEIQMMADIQQALDEMNPNLPRLEDN